MDPCSHLMPLLKMLKVETTTALQCAASLGLAGTQMVLGHPNAQGGDVPHVPHLPMAQSHPVLQRVISSAFPRDWFGDRGS